MASYVVMEPARGAGKSDAEEYSLHSRRLRADSRFSCPFYGFFGIAFGSKRRSPLAATVGLAALGNVTGFAARRAGACRLLVSLYAGLEGAALRIAALRRRGWSEVGIVEADTRGRRGNTLALSKPVPAWRSMPSREAARRSRAASQGCSVPRPGFFSIRAGA